jgi:hypothetical protein
MVGTMKIEISSVTAVDAKIALETVIAQHQNSLERLTPGTRFYAEALDAITVNQANYKKALIEINEALKGNYGKKAIY